MVRQWLRRVWPAKLVEGTRWCGVSSGRANVVPRSQKSRPLIFCLEGRAGPNAPGRAATSTRAVEEGGRAAARFTERALRIGVLRQAPVEQQQVRWALALLLRSRCSDARGQLRSLGANHDAALQEPPGSEPVGIPAAGGHHLFLLAVIPLGWRAAAAASL